MMKRCFIESVIGGVLAAGITYVYSHGNIAATLVTFAISVPAGYFGSRIRVKRQMKNSSEQ